MTDARTRRAREILDAQRPGWCKGAPSVGVRYDDAIAAMLAFADAERDATPGADRMVSAEAMRETLPDVSLVSRKVDDHCGCLEEEWDTPWGYLAVHLSAGKPSDATLDMGDEGERATVVNAPTTDAARAALFGWAALPAPASDGEGWQPIASAPRDGTRFIARGWDWGTVGGRRHVSEVIWNHHVGEFHSVYDPDESHAYLTDWLCAASDGVFVPNAGEVERLREAIKCEIALLRDADTSWAVGIRNRRSAALAPDRKGDR